ncbi:hypothetical protein N5P37_008811 [Trichoderma harzianum]|uniref:Uncharacterized protein n=1 Tax=Trichoderma harzianum CBS 226.95 TaxID=983964 RepID=A0A2T4A6Y7_TRIHA|nr:hypothetical protein M431DRAFT_18330 [Trichoderma harzianum CBS 226.95]KAK0758413.1 hypothetical protein N5P37_008811 [Trichoderma harzianum]PTB52839.1 hypothetical protein M431DRAFT_18330 [Trichoderma harzianum CBS 226.95]
MDMVQNPTLEQSMYAMLKGMRQIDHDINHLRNRLAYIEWRKNTLTSAYETISDKWEQETMEYEQYLLQTREFTAVVEQRIVEYGSPYVDHSAM